jgi:hypothetical protein
VLMMPQALSPEAKRFDEQGKGRLQLAAARVIEVVPQTQIDAVVTDQILRSCATYLCRIRGSTGTLADQSSSSHRNLLLGGTRAAGSNPSLCQTFP